MKRNPIVRLLVMFIIIVLATLPAAVAAPQPTANRTAGKQTRKVQSVAPNAQNGPKVNIGKKAQQPTQTPASITITSPSVGMRLAIGFNATISWTGTGSSGQPLGPVDITLWKGGQQTVILASSAAGPMLFVQSLKHYNGPRKQDR